MKKTLPTRNRRIWPIWLLVSCMMLLAGRLSAQAPAVTINPTGGNTATDGLQIIVTDTSLLVKKNGKWESNLNPSDDPKDRGLRTYVIIEPRLDAAVTPEDRYLKACQISPVKGNGTAGDPWKVITTSYMPDQDGVPYLFQTIISYINGQKYFLIDHVIIAPSGAHASYVHIYMSENSIIAGDECTRGYADNYVTGYDSYRITSSLPQIVGVYRDAGDCSGADAGAHVFKTTGGFTSYFAATAALRDGKISNGYPLTDVTNAIEAEKGIAVHKAIYFTGSSVADHKDEIKNKRFLIGFEKQDFSSVDITDPIYPVYEYPLFPLQIGFNAASGSGDEGAVRHTPTGLKLRVFNGVSGIPIAVKMTATPSGANPATAADYEILGSIVIPAGDYTMVPAEFDLDNIIIKGNTAIETNRTFTLTLSADCAPYVTLAANPTATYTIVDDDAIGIRLVPGATTLNEGEVTTVKIKMTGGTQPSPVVVTLNKGAGNAETGDYSLPATFPFVVTIPAGSTEASFTFAAVGDKVLEPVVDSVELLATATIAGIPTASQVFMRIVDTTWDNLANRVITLKADPALEGTNATITASLPAGITTEPALTVRVGFTHISTKAADFGVPVTDSVDIVIPANGNSGTYTLPIADDNIIELEEELAMGGVLHDFVVNGSNLHVIDADFVPGMPITLTATPNPARESQQVTLRASLPGTLITDHDIVITLTPGGASTISQIEDVNYLEDYMIISAGDHDVVGHLEFFTDDLLEPTEYLVLEGDATGFTVVPVTVEVTDDESADPASREISLTSTSYIYNEGQTAHVTLEIPKISSSDITITLTPGALTSASLDASEYAMPTIVTIPAGYTSVDFDIVFNSDALLDGTKILEVEATGDLFGHTEVAKRSFTINDATSSGGKNIIVTVDNTDVYEGADITFTFTLDGFTETTDTEITLTNGGVTYPVDDDDFLAPIPTSVTIPANTSSVTLTMTTNVDWVYETAEKLRLAFSAAGYTFNVGSLTVDIKGDDSEPGTIPLEMFFDNSNLDEGGAAATATVQLPWGLIAGYDIPVTITRAPTSQASGDDYSPLPSVVTILKGQSLVNFTLSALADDSLEVTELLTLNASSGTLLDVSADVYINDANTLDNAQTTLTIAPEHPVVHEGGAVTVWVSLPAGIYTTQDIPLTIYAGPGTSGTLGTSEYTMPTSITLPAGSNKVSFTVTAVDDGIAESPKTLQIVAEGSVFGHNNSVFTNLSVEDPAAPPQITVDVPSNSVTEGSSITINFNLPSGYTSPTPIIIDLAKGAVTPAAEDADFTAAIPSTVTIAANASSGSLTLSAKADQIVELLEKLRLTASSTGYTFDNDVIDLEIVDADYTAGMQITLGVSPSAVTEGGNSSLTASLPAGLTAGYDIDVTISKGASSTATADDHSLMPATLRIAAGNNASTAAVISTNTDDILEAAETVIAEGTATGFTVQAATLTINDATSTTPTNTKLTITPVATTITEGGSTSVTVSLPAGITTSTALVVTLSTGPGSSTGLTSADYDMPATVTIPAGGNSIAFTLDAESDGDIEGTEIMELIAQATVLGHPESASQLINILDASTAPIINVNVSSNSITEGSATTIRFSFPSGYTSATPVVISLAQGGTPPVATDADFQSAIPTSATIPANAFYVDVVLTAKADQVIEQLEHLQLTPSATGYTFSQSTINIDVADADYTAGMQLTLAVSPASVTEGSSTALTVSLPAGITAGYALNVTINKGSASTAGTADHSALPATITIPAGSNAAIAVTITTATDDLLENAETLVVQGALSGFTVQAATLTINDGTSADPLKRKITLTPAATTIAEGGSTTVTVSLPTGINTAAALTFSLSTGSATTMTAGEYNLPATVTIPAGSNSATFNVSANTDALTEGSEVLQIKASTTVYGHIETAFTSITVTDVVSAPVTIDISVSAASIAEGDATTVRFSLPSGYTSVTPIVINLAQGSVTPAATDADFQVAIPASATIATGDSYVEIVLTAKEDQVVEQLERLRLIPSSAGFSFSQASVDIDIADGDYTAGMPITLAVSPTSVTEGTGAGITASLPAGLTAGYDMDIVISKGAASTAAAGDHGALPATIRINAGSNASSSSAITTAADNLLETAETVVVEGTLSGFTVQTATLTINDATSTDPLKTKLTLTATATTIAEGASTTVTVALPTGVTVGAPLTINLSADAATTMSAGEYSFPATVTIPAGANSVQFTVTTNTDSSPESTETLVVKADATVYGSTETASLTINVTDATGTPTINVHVSSSSITEGAATTIRFSMPSGFTSATPTVISLAKGVVTPAVTDADFQSAIPTSATIPANAAYVDVVLTAKVDQIIEQLEHLQLIPSATGYNFSQSNINIDISDADYTAGMQLTLAVSPASVTEGTGAGISVSLPTGITAGYDLDVVISKGSASTAATGDHGALPATIRINAGSNASAAAAITTATDNLLEAAETVVIEGTLSGFTVQPATLTINDGTSADPLKTKLTLTATATTIAEGASTTVTVALPTGVTVAAPLTINLSAGAATTMTAGEYSFPSTVTIPAGANSVQFTVTANADAIPESTEMLEIKGDATVYGNTETAAVTISVTDASGTPTIDVNVSSNSITEGMATTIRFSLPSGFTSPTPIVISLAKGVVTPAVVDADFQSAIPTSATIPANAAYVDVVLTAKVDQVIEKLEKLQLLPSASGYNFSQSAINIDVADADYTAGMQLALAVSPASVTEGTGAGITVSLPAGITAGYDLDVVISKGAASTAAAGDHGALPGMIRINAGSNASSPVAITTATDNLLEAAETVVIEGALSGFTVQSATLTINDGTSADPLKTKITLTATATTIAEGASTTVTVALPAGVTVATSLTINLSAGVASTMSAGEYSIPATVTIPAGANSVQFTVIANTDSNLEGDETLVVKGDATVFGHAETGSVTITVTDATPAPAIDVHISAAMVNEGSSATIKFSLPSGYTSTSPIVINLAKGIVSPAATDADFQSAIPTSATIPANATFVDVVLTAKADQLVEQLEKLQLIPSASGFSFSQSAIDINVADGDYTAGMQVTLTVTPSSVTEGTGASITASLPAGLTAGYDIDVVISKGAASTAGAADHGVLPATIRINAGSNASAAASITTAADDILEAAETLVIQGTLSGFAVQPATLTINDATSTDPLKTKITLSATTTTIAEGASTTVTVALPANVYTATPLVINLSSGAATTMTAGEYTFPATVTIPAGANDVQFTVTANNDSHIETNEILEIKGDATVFGSAETGSVTITVTDATPAPVIDVHISSATITEGASTTIRFSLPSGYTSVYPIVIGLAEGTVTPAATSADFSAAIPTSATIAAGDTYAEITLTAKTDQLIEQMEKFQLIPSATGYTFSQTTIDLNIVDGDYTPGMPLAVTVTPAAVTEGGTASVVISLPGGLTADYDVDVTILKDVASTAGIDDHGALPATVRINAGSNAAAAFTVTTMTDDSLEVAETLIITGFANGFSVAPGTLTINDATGTDPLNHQLTLTPDAAAIKEGTSTQVWISLPGNIHTSNPITVNLSRGSASTASLAASEYSFPATVTIPAGANKVAFTLTATADDHVLELDETLQLSLAANVYGSAITANTNITIQDATSLIPANLQVTIAIDSAVLHEGNSSKVVVKLPAAITSDRNITVSLATGATSTVAAADYSALPATIQINAGDNEASFTLTAIQDNTEEDDETLVITGTAVDFTVNDGSVLIPGDEVPAFTVLAEKVTDAAEPSTNGRFTLKLSNGLTPRKDVSITFALTGTASAADYHAVTTAIIPAGQNSVDVTVDVTDDHIVEETESVILTLASANTIMNNKTVSVPVNLTQAIMELVDDDVLDLESRKVIINKVTDASEPDNKGRFTVQFANSATTVAADVIVNYTVSGTAVAGTDYTTLSGTVTIPAGQHSADIEVTPLDDMDQEEAETVIVTLSGATSTLYNITWEIGTPASATMNIGDDDMPKIEIEVTEISVTEGDVIHYKLKSSSIVAEDIPVKINITNDAFRNYNLFANPLTVTIPAGGNSKTFTINMSDNDINDDNGFVKLELQPYVTGPTAYYELGTANTVNTSIIDNDPVNVIFKQDSVKAMEGNSGTTPFAFTLQLNRRSSRQITVTYTYVDAFEGDGVAMNMRRATAGEDFDVSTVTVVIPTMVLEHDLAVPVIGDTDPEATEYFSVKLVKAGITSTQNVPTLGRWIRSTGVIVNDDPFCLTCDTDGDGLTDGQEDINGNGDPTDDDTDGDGIPNYLDLDSDNDGVADSVERYIRDGRVINDNKGDIRIHPAMSPNNDGKGNDIMMIENISKYPKNEVVVMNRHGDIVYKTKNYDNAANSFKGRATHGLGAGNDVPDGSYFYVVTVWDSNGKEHRTSGFLVLKR